VVRVGSAYWAAATTGGWRPPFALLRSRDLRSWRQVGTLLPRAPRWAAGRFWAPELSASRGHVLAYYSARRKRGGFCIAVASGRGLPGPLRDRGPLVCPPLGAIDPFPWRDQAGRPWLLWKQNGNAEGQPTPILAAPLTANGLRLAGPPRELIRNDRPWEGAVVEAPALVRHGGELFLLYATDRCCGTRCDYAVAAARAPSLEGPWTKHEGPLLIGSGGLRCPGHGSLVPGPRGTTFVFHGYGRGDPLNRSLWEAGLSWGADGWPRFGTPSAAEQRPAPVLESFRGRLEPGWQWPRRRPATRVVARRGGRLRMGVGELGRQPGQGSYVAETAFQASKGARAGMAVQDAAGLGLRAEVSGRRVALWRADRNGAVRVATRRLKRSGRLAIRIRVSGGVRLRVQVRQGRAWRRLGGEQRFPDGTESPRVALLVDGGPSARAAFERLTIEPL
jgi:xylan 1,4-beta-xylosidase